MVFNSQKPLLRKGRHRLRLWASVMKGAIVLRGRVAAQLGAPPNLLTIADIDGDPADTWAGQEVVITDGDGGGLIETAPIKARLRIRSEQKASSTALPVNEHDLGTYTWAATDRFYVLTEHRVRVKLPSADGKFSPDLVTFADNTRFYPPRVVSGGHWAGWADPATGRAEVPFWGSDTTAPGGTVTHFWDFGAGANPTTSTAANPVVSFPPGTRWIQHRVNGAGGKVWRQWVAVAVYSADIQPLEVEVGSLGMTLADGWACEFTARTPVFNADVPDGSLVLLWADDQIAGAAVPTAARRPDRKHIKFVGWLDDEGQRLRPDERTVSFRAISTLARLGKLAGYSQVLVDNPNPTGWQDFAGLSVNDTLWHLLQWYTTATEVADLFVDLPDKPYSRFYLQKQTPLAQTRELADALDAIVTSDARGNLLVYRDPDLDLAFSTVAFHNFTFQAEDVLSLDFDRAHAGVVELVEGRGFVQGTNTADNKPLFSRWPGNAPAEGTENVVVDRLIVTNQAELNTRTGLRAAKREGRRGSYEFIYRLGLEVAGPYGDLTDAGRQYVTVALPNALLLRMRQAGLTGPLVLDGVQTTFEAGTSTTTFDLHEQTQGVAGKTYVPPPEEDVGDYTDPGDDFVPGASGWEPVPGLPSQNNLTEATGELAVIGSDGHVYRNASPGVFTAYSKTPMAGLPAIGTNQTFTNAWTVLADPNGATTNGLLYATGTFGNDGYYKVVDVGGSPSGTLIRVADADLGYGVSGDAVWTGNAPGQTIAWHDFGKLYVSQDGGATFQLVFSDVNGYLEIVADPHQPGVFYVGTRVSGGPERVVRVEGTAVTDTLILTGAHRLAAAAMPFSAPGKLFWNSFNGGILRADVAMGVTTNITPAWGATYVNSERRFGLTGCSGDPERLAYVGRNTSTGAHGVFVIMNANSAAGAAQFETVVAPGMSVPWRRAILADPDGEAIFLMGTNGAFALARRNGGTWTLEDRMVPNTTATIIGVVGLG